MATVIQNRRERPREIPPFLWGLLPSSLRGEILERGEEMTLCRHVETGRVLPIWNGYLYETEKGVWCEDSTDLVLDVTAGERLSVVQRLSDRTLAKKKGVTGWYFGRLK